MTHETPPATTEFVPVPAHPGTVLVTVLDGVTILDGPDGQTLYRYDIPAEGIVAGWATQALIGQIRQLQHTPEDRVLVDAEPDASHELLLALSVHGLEVGETSPAPDPRPAPRIGEDEEPRTRSVLVTLAIAGTIVLVGIIYSLFAPQGSEDGRAAPDPTLSVVEEPAGTTASSPEPVPSTAPEETGAEPPAPEPERHVVGPVSVATETESQVEIDGNWTTFTGADETARYHVVVTPLEEAGGGRWRETMELRIAENVNLTHTGVYGEVLTYLETPGDGSQSRWFMQTVGSHHVSLVCQTRTEQTTNQAGTCEDFVASLQG